MAGLNENQAAELVHEAFTLARSGLEACHHHLVVTPAENPLTLP